MPNTVASSSLADRYDVHDFDIAKVLPPNTVLYTATEPCNERLGGNRTWVERISALSGLNGATRVVYVGIREPDSFIKHNEGVMRLEDARVMVVMLDDAEIRGRDHKLGRVLEVPVQQEQGQKTGKQALYMMTWNCENLSGT
ncbi:uncharacterized protein B0T15DRAFT_513360 [Chaetomium strumarium]|uniref:Uncharacterized protein n=1 Tax=Chaetomium strumarium TaxID=1170767 RepID=A0AAJ0LZC0_9PEZI|nr:hypothetical protein B0T15DRAFT_513360 [Chaetomium strumarium]